MLDNALPQSDMRLTPESLKAMPKIDLHRHLEGSLRLKTLLEIAQKYGLDMPAADTDRLRPLVQITDDPPDFEVFLSKFEVLRHFYRSPEAIHRLAYEVVADAALDNIHYLELRFSPQALARVRGFSLSEVADWVIDASQKASADLGIKVRLIVTLVRHDPIEQAKLVAEVAFERFGRGIVGLDLAGNEVKFPAGPFIPLFAEAKRLGMGVTVHAGEWASAEGVRQAIEELHADRIGHGVRSIENSRILRLVRDRQVALEVCLTSNLQTGVVRQLHHHPLVDLLNLGIKVTLNTDDPSISNLSLTDEFRVAVEMLGLGHDELQKLVMNAVQATFLPENERQRLHAYFRKHFQTAE